MTDSVCTLYLVRHGQSVANANDTYGLDTDLTEKGMEQIETLATNLNNIHFDTIYSSPMKRAIQSAIILSNKFNLSIQSEIGLKERYYGILEGKKGSAMKEELFELFKKRSSLPLKKRMAFKFSHDYESDDEVLKRYVPTIKLLLIAYGARDHHDFEGQAIVNSGYTKIQSNGYDIDIISIIGRQSDNSLNDQTR
ncbi:MAG: putative phosphoserine phosphatase 2 [Microgenomates bacterium OLB23]|nr:MAG: putative phosphoserine phosphatase 2 [Microgenomates bacterium OLB23]